MLGNLDKLYMITPTPMIEWLNLFIKDSLDYPENVVVIASSTLNPETCYYYQPKEQGLSN